MDLDEFDRRLARLSDRIAGTIAEVASRPSVGQPLAAAESTEQDAATIIHLLGRVETAESHASLQAQRCAMLEDQIEILERAIKASSRPPPDNPASSNDLQDRLGTAMLDIERLTSERDALRRAVNELREKARGAGKQVPELEQRVARAEAERDSLRQREADHKRRLEELERSNVEQKRELELAEKRNAHLRRHLNQ